MAIADALVWDPLFDGYGRRHDYLRVSLTDRCNFRCVYCMPDEEVEWKHQSEILSLEEIERLVRIFVRLGVRKLRLTGGEPTVRRGYIDLIETVSPLVSTYLTTNGTTLRIHADRMRKAGLVGVNISIDSLIPERFLQITQRDALHLVLDGIGAAVEAGLATKLNVVVMRHLNADELCDFVEFVRTRPVQVRFIEFMPFLGNQWSVDDVFSFQEMKEQIQSKYDLIPRTRLTSDVATEFTIDGFSGTVGFVTSVTESFCEGCNRLRLTADGRFKTCLFTPPQSGLRDMLRSGASDEDLAIAIRTDLSGKWKGHPSMKSWQQRDTLTMVQIGG